MAEDHKGNQANVDYARGQGLSVKQYRTQLKLFRDHYISKGTLNADWDAAWRTWVQKAICQFGLKPEHAKQMEKQRKIEAVVDFIIDCRDKGDEQQKIINKILDSDPHLGWRGLHNGELKNCFELADQKQGVDSPPKT